MPQLFLPFFSRSGRAMTDGDNPCRRHRRGTVTIKGGSLFVSLTSVLNPHSDCVGHLCGLLSPESQSQFCTHVACRGSRPVAMSLWKFSPSPSESRSLISTKPKDIQMDPGLSIDDGSSVGGLKIRRCTHHVGSKHHRGALWGWGRGGVCRVAPGRQFPLLEPL